MQKSKHLFSLLLAFVMVLSLLIVQTPQTAFADAKVTYTYAQNGNTGATITFSSAVTAVSVSEEGLAEAAFSENTVTVIAKSGAVGVVTVSVTAGGLVQKIAVPVGYTTFLFDGDTVTVYKGKDTNYGVTGYDSAETEYTPSQAANPNGSVTYAADAAYSLCVEIKKSGGIYAFAGSGEDMSIAVKKNATADATLLLAGLDLKSSMTAPITVKKKDDEAAIAADAKVAITVLEGHENTLADTAFNNADDYADNVLAESAVIKGKSYADIILDGHGTLNLTSATKNAVKVAEYGSLTIRNLTLNVTSAKHGLSSDNEMTLWSGDIHITANGDGVRSDPDVVDAANGAAGNISFYDAVVTINAANDGVQAAQDLTIYGGIFDITTYNGYQNNKALEAADLSAKGLKASKSSSDDTTDTTEATNTLHIYNGSFSLNCADDAIHSDAYAIIEGGEFTIYTGDDGAHADTSLTLGKENGQDCDVLMQIKSCYEGLEAGNVYVFSGSYDIVSSDDGINAAGGNDGSTEGFNPGGGPGGPGGHGWPGGQGFNPGGESAAGDYSINISGGLIKIAASGDGIDSNEVLNMTGGTTVVFGGQGAENPLDYDGNFYINGATVFAAGFNSMAVRSPISGSQSYKTATTSLTQGRTVTVTVNGETVVSQVIPSRASYEFYSQPTAFSSMTVTQGTEAAQNIPATFAAHTDSCGHLTNASSGIADPSASSSDDRVDSLGNEPADEGFAVSFVLDGKCTVNVYPTQDVSGTPYAVITADRVTFANGYSALVSRNSSTGEPDSTGDGQVNFVIIPETGNEVESVTVAGTYKNLKDQSSSAGVENCWRVTKVGSEITITVKATESAAPTETPTPIPTSTPVPTSTPTPTDTPVPTATPIPTSTPVPTDTPVPTSTPVPTDTPVPTAAPIPTSTPVPTDTPNPTSTPVPTDTPVPTAAPIPTSTPVPTDTPVPTSTPVPTDTPAPTSTPIPTSTPTPTPILAKQVSLNKSSAKVLVGLTLQLKVSVTPANAEDSKITWKSSNTNIATVSSSGLVTAKSAGTVTIRAMTESGLKAYCKVTVTFRYVYECEKDGVYRYTTNTAIVRQLRDEGWTYRKAFRTPGYSSQKVYWIYNKTTKRYRYTTDLSYAKKMKADGNKAGFAFYQSEDTSKPVYELQKGSKRITYFYTTSITVRDKMITQGWTYTHIAWYAQPKA